MSLRNRIAVLVFASLALSLVVLAFQSYVIASQESQHALVESVTDKLTTERTLVIEQIDQYLAFIQGQVQEKASARETLLAAKQFIRAFNAYESQRGALTSTNSSALSSYYQTSFVNRFQQLNGEPVANVNHLVQPLSDNAKALQTDFIAQSRFPLGEKDKLYDLANGTDYAQVHRTHHPEFHRFLQSFGYYDVFIADAATGNIVYSVFKELDFATRAC